MCCLALFQMLECVAAMSYCCAQGKQLIDNDGIHGARERTEFWQLLFSYIGESRFFQVRMSPVCLLQSFAVDAVPAQVRKRGEVSKCEPETTRPAVS